MTRLLASVRNLTEARLALSGGADLLDFKEPSHGALGAVALSALRGMRPALGPGVTLSATIGDRPMDPPGVIRAVVQTAATGVDYVKVGFFPDGDWDRCLDALATIGTGTAIVAVLFADRYVPPRALLQSVRAAGLRGAMLDTADKLHGLRRHLDDRQLAGFVDNCRDLGLLCGLAGSLSIEDIAPLLALSPDYLGFRGALCGGERRAQLDPACLAAVRARIPARDVRPRALA